MASTNTVSVDVFELDAASLDKSAINAVRAAFGLVGILALGLGIALLVWPGRTVVVAAALVGIYFVIAGIARLALSIFSRGLSAGHRILGLLLGLIVLAAGIIVMRNLDASAAVLVLIAVIALGIGWIVDGIMAFVESGRGNGGGWGVAFGIFSILAGIVVLAWPGITALAFAMLAGITLCILGVVGVVRAFTFGKDAKAAA
ncbi:HdeD family acid-resistance protein [Demequina sp.]|uniref:HdeD family acid-resistance protein n=1 Tax=Demequina sp. TaxID=2050685 RepID=UPI003D0C272D